MLQMADSRRRFVMPKEAAIGANEPADVEVLPDGRVRVDMGPVRFGWRDIPLAREMDTLHLQLGSGVLADPAGASMGNPHATFFVSDVESVPIAQLGPGLEHDPLFPQRANIGVAQVLGADRIRLRVWERGAGLTLACGSGACAAVVNAVRRNLTDRRVAVEMPGGELTIEWDAHGHVQMTGPAVVSFTGQVELP